MSDDGDFSSQNEIDEHERIFKERARVKQEEEKLINLVRIEAGVKYCIDCEDEISPPARALIRTVIRCLDCQEFLEKEKRSFN